MGHLLLLYHLLVLHQEKNHFQIVENNLIDQVNYLIITAHFSDHLDIRSINKFSKKEKKQNKKSGNKNK